DAFGLQPVDDLALGIGDAQAVQEGTVDGGAFTDVGFALPALRWLDGADDRQVENLGEIPVALVLTGDGHDGRGAVGGQDVIGDPDRDFLLIYRIDRVGAGEDASLFLGQFGTLQIALAGGLGLVRLDGGFLLVRGDGINQGMLGGQHHVGGAEERIWARSKDADRSFGPSSGHGWGQRKIDFGTFALADPIALHLLDRFRPVHLLQ